MTRSARLLLPCLALALPACAPVTGSYVWVDDYHPHAVQAHEGLVIKPGDTVDVRVFNQDQMSGRAKVRSDGRVTLPFLNDVEAAGFTPGVLAQQIQTRLKDYINAPVVTVSVDEAKPAPVSVLGQVARPGQYAFENAGTVAQALAVAGGLTEFAKRDRIFVLRAGPPQERIRFRYRQLLQIEGRAASFQLEGGDVVVVD